jgi:Protein of unknown function (DUF3574)
MKFIAAKVCAVILVVGCANAPPQHSALTCASGDIAMLKEVLYFGRNHPAGTVSDGQWRAFLDDIITPRFPAGLTIQAATGQWQRTDGAIEREPSMLVTILHADDARGRRAIEEIIERYKHAFEQEAVLRETAPACVRY